MDLPKLAFLAISARISKLLFTTNGPFSHSGSNMLLDVDRFKGARNYLIIHELPVTKGRSLAKCSGYEKLVCCNVQPRQHSLGT